MIIQNYKFKRENVSMSWFVAVLNRMGGDAKPRERVASSDVKRMNGEREEERGGNEESKEDREREVEVRRWNKQDGTEKVKEKEESR